MIKNKNYENKLSDEEIMELYKKDKNTGINLMIEKYSDYIHYVINKYYPSFSRETEDMYQNGVIGIIEAMKNYQADKASFTTYCTPFVKKEISKHVRFVASEKSEYFATVHNHVEKAKTALETRGKDINVENLMEETGLSEKIVKREMKVDRTKVSYEALAEIGTSLSLSDSFIVDDMLSGTTSIRKEIIKMKVIEELTFKAIAQKLQLTEFRVKKEYSNGIDDIKESM